MNLLANPCFQIKQRGASFNLVETGQYTLDRWVSISDYNGRTNIKQVEAPLGCEVEFNSDGFGGIMQVLERDQVKAEVGRAKTFALDIRKNVGAAKAWIGVLAWGGTVDKPLLAPFASFSCTAPTMAANWSVVAAQEITVTDTRERYSIEIPSMPDAQNIAVGVLFEGEAGDWFIVSDTAFNRDGVFDGYNYADELRRCSWFYQFYGYDILMNTEWGVGRSDYGNFISFQFPLSFPLRGRLGGIGVYDIDVDWPVALGGYWLYAGAKVQTMAAPPVMTCHHRHFVLFTTPRGNIPYYDTAVWRHWQDQPNAYISFDAELKS